MDSFLNMDLVDKKVTSQMPRPAVVDEFTKAIMKI
jgi:hypothetical protein